MVVAAMDDAARIETVMRYHEWTQHHLNRYAPGPGKLDWANQPNPFRRYEGAPLACLPLLGPDDEPASPQYEDLYRRGAVPSMPLTIRSLSRLLQYGLAISAWKRWRHALGVVLQSVQRQPASDRVLRATQGDVFKHFPTKDAIGLAAMR